MAEPAFEWGGKPLNTIGDLLDAVCAVTSREEAQRFMTAYREVNAHAGDDIGYLAGYCDSETAKRIWDWFECAHPVSGTHYATFGEAFSAGQRRAAGGES